LPPDLITVQHGGANTVVRAMNVNMFGDPVTPKPLNRFP